MEHYDWNEGWLFAPTFDPALVRPECPELSLTPVRLPHTVKPLPYNYCNENDYQRLCGYRREFFAPKEWLGRTVLLTFGAVAHDATVFCNGRRVFHHGCGYTAFTVDLTGALQLGQKNVVAVRCDSREDLNVPPFGGQLDALTYGGIYRAVSLDIKEPAYLRDVFIEAKAEGDFRIYTATVGETVGCTLQAEIRSPAGSRAVYSGELSLPITGTLNNVHPWSLEHPTLYTLTMRLIRPGTGGLPDRVLDEKTVRFGFRTVQFVAGGLYLNGQRVELRGLDRHQSYPYQGYAMPDSIQRLDAQLLKKELGCNAVRTCYAPPSPAFLDACDELGLLVFPEMPGWQHIGDEVWQAQALQNCREMVCQYRNHPSIFLWGARISGSPDNEAFYKRTNEAIHRLDPTRPTAGTRSTRKSQLLEDVYAYNDYSYAGRGAGCENRAAVTPDTRKGYLISEFGGQNFPAKPFDDEPHRLVQALHHAAVLNDSIAQPGVAGSFGWCMADYNTHREFGSGDRICYHGVMDLFRNPKLSAAVYASQKTPRAPSDIVLEVSSAMTLGDLPGGAAAACWVFTNAESVRLYRGNDFVAEFGPDRRGRFAALPHPPIEINDFVGSLLEKYEGMDHATGAQVCRHPQRAAARRHGAFAPVQGADALAAAELERAAADVLQVHRCAGQFRAGVPVRGGMAWPRRAHRGAGAGAERPAGMHRAQSPADRWPHMGLRRSQPARHRPERQPAALLRRGRLPVRGRAAENSRSQRSAPAGRHGGHLPCHHRRGRTRRAALPHGGRTGHGGGAHRAQPGGAKRLIFVLS